MITSQTVKSVPKQTFLVFAASCTSLNYAGLGMLSVCQTTASQNDCFMENCLLERGLGVVRKKKRCKDAIKSSLKAFNIDHNSWEQKALNRPMWRSLIITGSKAFEEDRKTAAEQKRHAQEVTLAK